MPITATRTTTFKPGGDQDNDGFVDFGDVLRHTLVVSNTATNATGVTVTDPLNGSTLTGNVNVSPLALNDSFSAIGNTLLEVGNATAQTGPQSSFAGSVTSNDVEFLGDTFTVSAFDATSANGGTVTMVTSGADMGSFTYVSAAGFVGDDTFSYTVRDDGLDGIAGNSDDLLSTATVTVTVANKVWYVDSTAAPGGTGTSTNPFSGLTQLNGLTGDGSTNDDVDGANDFIHVRGTTTGSGLVLENGQQLVGTGVDLIVGGNTLLATGANSAITQSAAGFTITLGSGNTIAGVDISNAGGGGITGTGFGTLTVDDVALNTSGQALGLNTGAIAGTGFNSTTSAGGTSNVNLQTVTGTLNLGSGTLSGATSNAVVINGGGGSVDYNGSITHAANGHAIQVINKTGGSVDFDGSVTSNTQSDGIFLSTNTGATINFDGGLAINTSASNTTGFQATGGGTISVTGAGNTISSGTGTALDLSGVTVGATGVTFSSVNTSGANGVLLNTVGQAAGSSGIDILGGTIASASTRGVDINATSADVSVAATISTTAAGRSVEVTNSGSAVAGGSTINFSGAIDENGTGINLDNNDTGNGATINFSGGLDIDSASGNFGLNAINGGTVTVTGSNNAIDTTNGIGLNVTGTSIGAADLTFNHISTNGGTSGIVLNGTGTGAGAGGLTVTGDVGSAVNGSGGVIQNTSGAAAISITNARDVSLDQMTVQNNAGDGINGSTVTNFSLTNSTVNNNGDALQEHGVDFTEVTGTVTFTNDTFSNNETSQVRFINTSGTVDAQFSGSSFSSTGLAAAPNGLHGLHFETQGTANGDLRVLNSAFNNLFSNSIHTTNEGTGTLEVTVANSTFNNIGASAINLVQNNSGTTRFWIHDNPTFLKGTNNGVSNVINVNQAGGTPAGAVLEGRINGNTIGNNTGPDSGSSGGYGVTVISVGSGTTNVQVDNNNIQGTIGGILVQMGEDPNPAHTMNATIFNNSVTLTHPVNSFNGIYMAAGTSSSGGGDAGIFRLDMHDNDVNAGSSGSNDFYVRSRFNTQMQLLNYAGGTNEANLQTYLDATRNNNPAAGGANDWYLTPSQSGNYANTASVPTPNLPSPLRIDPTNGHTPPSSLADDPNGSGGAGPQGDLAPGGTPVPGSVVVDDGLLSQAELALIVGAAIDRWAAAGATEAQLAAMRAVDISVEDLAGLNVGLSEAGTIRLDVNAAGYNWFVDATPGDDSEYTGSGTLLNAAAQTQAGDRVDLLTTVMHELGHQIGLGDIYADGQLSELMYGLIAIGQRRLPGADDAAGGTGEVTGSAALALVPINLGTIPAGRSITLMWDSTLDTWSAGLAPTYTNASTIAGSNPGAFSVTSNTETLGVASAPALDTLTLGGTVWADSGTGGGTRGDGLQNGTEAGVDGVLVTLFIDNGVTAGVWDASDTLVTTTTTAAGGVYSFAGIGAGEYIVSVDQDNFDAGGNVSLLNLQSSPVTAPEPIDPDNNVDGDDNGSRTPGQAAYSGAITLAFNSEPTADGTGKFDINTTLDFGFVAPNLAPTSTSLSGDAVTWTEGDGPAVLDIAGNAAISDADSADFAGGTLTVDITAGEVAAEDVLSIATSGGVTSTGTTVSVGGTQIATYTGGTGGTPLVFTLDPDATPSTVSTLVHALQYSNSGGEDPSGGTRTLTWTLVDGDGTAGGGADTLTVNTTVEVVSVNDEPAGGNETVVVNEDDVHAFSLSDFNFSDTDGDSLLQVVITTLPANGTLSLNGVAIALAGTAVDAADIGSGLLTFEPDANDNGTGYASFTFQVRDDGGTANGGQDTDQTPDTMTIDVTALNDAPVNVVGATVNATEGDVGIVLSTTGSAMSVSDIDASGTVTYSLSVANGALTIRTDVAGGITAADVTGNGTSDVNVLATTAAINVTLAAGSGLLYTPATDFSGTDTLEVYVNDAGQTGLDTDLASVVSPAVGAVTEEDYDTRSIIMAAVDDAPVAQNDAVTTAENVVGTGSVLLNNGSGADTDIDGPALAVAAVNGLAGNVGTQITLVSGALLTLNANGTYSYDPNGAFDYLVSSVTALATGAVNSSATDSFTYTLVGGGTATVTMTVTGVDGAGDQLWGNSGDNIINGGGGADYFDLSQGGNDTANGAGGTDAFYFGAAFTAADTVNGGAGNNDQIGLEGNYTGANALVLGAGTISGVEVIALLPGFDYDLTTVDANVPNGGTLKISASILGVGDDFTFDGSAETDGKFLVFGGLGADVIKTGAGVDGIYFGPGKFDPTVDRVDGGSGINDQLALDGDYTLTLDGIAIKNIDVIALLKGIPGDLADYNLTLANSLTLAGQTTTIWGSQVDTVLTVNGAAESDGALRIFGGTLGDTLTGGAGDDWFWGGLGGDTMTGGLGADTFMFESVAQSTIGGHDQIVGFDDTVDKIDLPGAPGVAVTSFATGVLGTLNAATLESDIGGGSGGLGAHQALVFTANGGDLNGHTFLVVDANGTAGYQAAGDFLIEFVAPVSPLDQLGMFV